MNVHSEVRAAVKSSPIVYSEDPAVQKLVLHMMDELKCRKGIAGPHYKVKKVAAINGHRVVFKCCERPKGLKTGKKTWVAIKGLKLDKVKDAASSGNKSRSKVRRRSDQQSAEAELEILNAMLNTSGTGRQLQGVVPILDSFYSKSFLFVVTPWINGGDLYEHLNAVPDKELEDKMELELMARWFCEIAASLAVVHKKGYAHRDLSPENILITCDKRVKIHDFGLACDASRQKGSVGKVLYAAPELFTPSKGSYDPRAADIWSLAILFFTMLTKHAPMGSATTGDPHFQMYRKGPRSFIHILLEQHKLEGTMTTEAIDLFIRMAKENPAERLTIQEVLQHPFVLRHGRNSDNMSCPQLVTRSRSMPCLGVIKRACKEFVGNLIKENKINNNF